MKKTEIELGKVYSDGKGNVRLIIGVGREYLSYSGQMETDCLRYKVLEKKLGPRMPGDEVNCTRQAFASWARMIIPL